MNTGRKWLFQHEYEIRGDIDEDSETGSTNYSSYDAHGRMLRNGI